MISFVTYRVDFFKKKIINLTDWYILLISALFSRYGYEIIKLIVTKKMERRLQR